MIPEIHLRPAHEQRVREGGLWAFRNELDLRQKDHGSGTWVRLLSSRDRPMAVGFLNTRSSLSFRAVARSGEFAAEEEPAAIIQARLKAAWEMREALGLPAGGRRLVFAEGDGLPGLVVDQYGSVLVAQIGTAGMDQHRALIFDELKALSGCKAIVERSEGSGRDKEGLAAVTGLAWSSKTFKAAGLSAHPVKEGGWTFHADVLKGQKTGFFLDQREARALAATLSKGRACLDVFCHSGGFSVALASGGAASVLGLDASDTALFLARKNAEANKVEGLCSFEAGDAFERLRALEKEGRRFGVVVLDPPAMTKGKEGLEGALRGYKELNLRGLRLLEPGGWLLSCSCTQAVDEAQFERQVVTAASDAPASLRQVARLTQPADHPWVPAMPETRYLKVGLYKKV